MFCPKCGSLLIPKKDGNRRILVCSCGFKDTKAEETRITEIKRDVKHVEIVDIDQSETQSLPLTDAKCPQCGYEKAHYWMVQTRASDEPETKFHRCKSCKHVWRDYS